MTSPHPQPPVFIGCGVVVADDVGGILLVKEGNGPSVGRWSLPAGKLERGETLVEAAVREATEETGVTVEVHDLLGIYHSPVTSEASYGVNFVFRASRIAGEAQASADHPEVAFVTRADIDEMIESRRFRSSDLMIRILDDLDAGRSLALDRIATIALDLPS